MKLLEKILRRYNLRFEVKPPNGRHTKFYVQLWKEARPRLFGEALYIGEADDLEEAIARAVDCFLGDRKEAA